MKKTLCTMTLQTAKSRDGAAEIVAVSRATQTSAMIVLPGFSEESLGAFNGRTIRYSDGYTRED
ncbi:hypothetical protein JWG42_11045 [Desulfoprunum benzoelyticum]|uniref:Uncharacterized protein n=1 Tax=Desulfoprunum benzoelyticum TaxID=1506996 RepID=A0A840UPW2_9BACT|nr:hypothetical protein [Desulfoprunum benzoelyticum]MBB5347822.1 hypothetical protein [Desulfoprunum benzoelyticum]MBM9530685.1 hypothetical protein [Desulfoprunum benzoelyticum]